LEPKWSDCSVVKICYADVHLLRSLEKIIRGNVAREIMRLVPSYMGSRHLGL